MKEFNFSGVVGWDVMPSDMRKFLLEAAGDDIKILFSSRGGFVGDGLEMFNMLRNYPGHVTAVLSGYAMSMASYIPLAADRIIAEDNAVFMIHNVHGGVYGDHNYILKYGNETAALSKLLAGAYVRHTGMDLEELQQMMDQETYFYGQEIVEAGFAHELAETENEDDKDNCIALARTAHRDCRKMLAENMQAAADDIIRAAALAEKYQPTNKRAAKPTTTSTTEQKTMDLQTLKKEHPDLVVALSEEVMAGINKESLQAANPDLVIAIAADGAENERARMQDVRDQLIPGHESLIAAMEADGTSTGADAAKAIIVAEKEARAKAGVTLEHQTNQVVNTTSPDNTEGKKEMTRADFDRLPIAEQRAFSQNGGIVKD